MPLTVSVAIPTRNRCGSLARVLDAVLPQAATAGAEVLVVDNGSSDGTPDVIAARGVRAVVEPTPGATRARNTAARAACGDVLAFIDDDALPAPGWLAALVRPFADPRVAYVGGRVRLRFEGTPPGWWDGGLDDYLSAYDLGPEPVDLATRPWHEAPRGANMAIRRAALVAVGGFNLRLGPRAGRHIVAEESDLSLRLLARGDAVRYVPDAVVDHLVDVARLDPAWLCRRAFWGGWSEAIVALAHRRARKVAGTVRWHYGPRALRVPYRPHGAPDPARLRAECARREAWGFILGVLRHAPLRHRLVVRETSW